jgi:hypothetical protein
VLIGHAMTLSLRNQPSLLSVFLLLSLLYVGYLVLRTAITIQRPDEILPLDLILCRWCWLFILGPVTIFLTTAYSMEAKGLDPNRIIFGYDSSWLIFQWMMEAGLVFCVATIFSPISVTLSRPRILWKIVSVPMAFAHEFYVVGSLTRGFGQAS